MKLVVVDIDGTLINSPLQTEPSDEFASIVQKLRHDVLVTCATGRPVTWAMPVLKKARFSAPPIVSGGSLILHPENFSVDHTYMLPNAQFQKIKEILQEYPNLSVIFDDYEPEEYMHGGWPLQRLLDQPNCYMLEIVYVSKPLADELTAVLRQLPHITVIQMRSLIGDTYEIHIVSNISTKEHAIKVLQEELGISKEDTIGIGDGHNDVHLFNAVGTKIAVGNAVEELKRLADEAIGPVNDDPVTDYLARYLN